MNVLGWPVHLAQQYMEAYNSSLSTLRDGSTDYRTCNTALVMKGAEEQYRCHPCRFTKLDQLFGIEDGPGGNTF